MLDARYDRSSEEREGASRNSGLSEWNERKSSSELSEFEIADVLPRCANLKGGNISCSIEQSSRVVSEAPFLIRMH